ncbi:putative holin-like toxin, partial [Enterococcus durans]
MSTFEAIQLMIAFATLVLLIIDSKDQKKALYFLMLVNFANIFFCIKKYRKDTLKSFRINLANKFIGGF